MLFVLVCIALDLGLIMALVYTLGIVGLALTAPHLDTVADLRYPFILGSYNELLSKRKLTLRVMIATTTVTPMAVA